MHGCLHAFRVELGLPCLSLLPVLSFSVSRPVSSLSLIFVYLSCVITLYCKIVSQAHVLRITCPGLQIGGELQNMVFKRSEGPLTRNKKWEERWNDFALRFREQFAAIRNLRKAVSAELGMAPHGVGTPEHNLNMLFDHLLKSQATQCTCNEDRNQRICVKSPSLDVWLFQN